MRILQRRDFINSISAATGETGTLEDAIELPRFRRDVCVHLLETLTTAEIVRWYYAEAVAARSKVKRNHLRVGEFRYCSAIQTKCEQFATGRLQDNDFDFSATMTAHRTAINDLVGRDRREFAPVLRLSRRNTDCSERQNNE